MATDKKILFITGGNTGLGLEAVKALCQSQNAYEIIIGCRTVSKDQNDSTLSSSMGCTKRRAVQAFGVLELRFLTPNIAVAELMKQFPQTASTLTTVQADLESDESLEKAVSEISSKYGRLDVLINNGGASFDYEILEGRMSLREGFNASWNVNVTGTHILTTLAVPLLLKSSDPRLIFLASGTSTLTETERADISCTEAAKTGLNMLMREWRRTLLNDSVKVWAVSPGFLATGLGGFGEENLKQMGALDPSIGGHFLKDVVEGKRDQDEGKVIRRDMIQPW
ncbi:hypothetical protein NUW58_g2305 [Xylaria curta]|uniref:Uncharacterized protein n=1 Tax=Xylaria curta TaxID=42375 RepID=A0ACC1PIY2_9PEZI|nr:hypothetical protein NUW58_g2305 [Xylaria curta]